MAAGHVLDFDALLAPISAEAPAGPELRSHESLVSRLRDVRDARKDARDAERQLQEIEIAGAIDGAPPLESPDWKKVASAAIDVLANDSKDLWVAAWLIEALVREHGFAGLRDGFQLVRELCEKYWEHIHPQPDPSEGDEATITTEQLEGLNNSLIGPIYQIPVTGGSNRYSCIDFKEAVELEQITDPESRQRRIDDGAVTKNDFDKDVTDTPATFSTDLAETVDECLREFERMHEVLEEKCGFDDGYSRAPRSSELRDVLADCQHQVQLIYGHLVRDDRPEELAETPESTQLATRQTPGAAVDGQVATREDAFRLMGRIADFFERTEPHSPVSYALRQVVSWGHMSLPELLSELIEDTEVRDKLFRRAGIPRPPTRAEED